MAKYYYNKYDATAQYTEGPFNFLTNAPGWDPYPQLYPSYSFNSSTRLYSVFGTRADVPWSNGATGYEISTYNGVYAAAVIRFRGTANYAEWADYRSFNDQGTTYYVQGGLVTANIIAEDGTYPVNGRHTDGFWYVRGALVFPAIKVNIGGVWKAGASGAVNINGIWKPFNDMWVNENGIWKKS